MYLHRLLKSSRRKYSLPQKFQASLLSRNQALGHHPAGGHSKTLAIRLHKQMLSAVLRRAMPELELKRHPCMVQRKLTAMHLELASAAIQTHQGFKALQTLWLHLVQKKMLTTDVWRNTVGSVRRNRVYLKSSISLLVLL